MGIGFGLLRLAPDAFWRMTPRELAAVVEALLGPGGKPFTRAALEGLMQRFPDTKDSPHDRSHC
jgi:uncharacterized phage protein (TIGR02216 family)